MYILSVDTTAKTATCAVSLVKDNDVFPICDARLNSTLTHSESILPMIDFCLKNAGVSLSETEVLAISAGPGSFTGVRIGIASIKAIAKVTNKKIFGTTSLELLALDGIKKCNFNIFEIKY